MDRRLGPALTGRPRESCRLLPSAPPVSRGRSCSAIERVAGKVLRDRARSQGAKTANEGLQGLPGGNRPRVAGDRAVAGRSHSLKSSRLVALCPAEVTPENSKRVRGAKHKPTPTLRLPGVPTAALTGPLHPAPRRSTHQAHRPGAQVQEPPEKVQGSQPMHLAQQHLRREGHGVTERACDAKPWTSCCRSRHSGGLAGRLGRTYPPRQAPHVHARTG